ncbi:UNVERIFIED_CONTAM: hypothetical protein K2H54_031685 [Gekko kuhli]
MGRRAEGPGPAWGSLLVLAAAILNSGFLLAHAQDIPVITKPSQAERGHNITLTPGGKYNFVLCYWYRERQAEANRILTYIPTVHEQQPGPSFTGRETGGPGCSLHIRDLRLNDTGDYIVTKVALGGSETGRVQIEVIVRRVVNPDENVQTSKGVVAGIAVGAAAGALLIGILF